jgi:hypothetical protein
MKTTIEMAREVYGAHTEWSGAPLDRLEQLVALVRADELKQGQKWFDAVTAQHKQMILAEREACAKVCDRYVDYSSNPMNFAENCAQEIRSRGNT